MSSTVLKEKLDKILGFLSIKPKVTVEEEKDSYKIIIEGDNLNFLIGYRGESLNALQSILSMMLFKELGNWIHLVVDINGYRNARQDKIEQITKNFIDRVRFFNNDVPMPSMNPYERRLVHLLVSEYPDVESESAGEGRDRHVVLRLVKRP